MHMYTANRLLCHELLGELNIRRAKKRKANWILTLIKFVISGVYDRAATWGLCVAGQLSLAQDSV